MNVTGIIIVLAYLAITVGVVLWIGSRTKKTYADFAVGSGSLPWIVVAGTMIASNIGGGTLIGYVGNFYQLGWQWLWMGVGIATSATLLVVYFGKRFKRLNATTLADIFYTRYGKEAKYIATVIVFLGEIAVFCSMSASFGSLASSYLGVNLDLALIVGIILFCFTASAGGFKGVAYTDAIQAAMIIVGCVGVAVAVFFKAGGMETYTTYEASHTFINGGQIAGMVMFGNVLAVICNGLSSQSITFQRISATRSEKDATKALSLRAISVLAIVALMGVMGIGASVLLPEGVAGNAVISELMKVAVPPVIGALYIAVIISAVFTTANSCILSASMNVAKDIYAPMKKDVKDADLIRVSKIVIAIGGIIAYFVVKLVPSVIDLLMMVYNIQASLVVALYIGMMWKKAGRYAGMFSLIGSGFGGIVCEILSNFFNITLPIHSIFITLILGILGLIIGACMDKPTEEQIKVVETFRGI